MTHGSDVMRNMDGNVLVEEVRHRAVTWRSVWPCTCRKSVSQDCDVVRYVAMYL